MDEDVVASTRPSKLEPKRLEEPPQVGKRDVREISASHTRQESPRIHDATLAAKPGGVVSALSPDERTRRSGEWSRAQRLPGTAALPGELICESRWHFELQFIQARRRARQPLIGGGALDATGWSSNLLSNRQVRSCVQPEFECRSSPSSRWPHGKVDAVGVPRPACWLRSRRVGLSRLSWLCEGSSEMEGELSIDRLSANEPEGQAVTASAAGEVCFVQR